MKNFIKQFSKYFIMVAIIRILKSKIDKSKGKSKRKLGR